MECRCPTLVDTATPPEFVGEPGSNMDSRLVPLERNCSADTAVDRSELGRKPKIVNILAQNRGNLRSSIGLRRACLLHRRPTPGVVGYCLLDGVGLLVVGHECRLPISCHFRPFDGDRVRWPSFALVALKSLMVNKHSYNYRARRYWNIGHDSLSIAWIMNLTNLNYLQ